MTGHEAGTICQTEGLEELIRHLAPRLREIGLSVSFWDALGAPQGAPNLHGEFCRTLCQDGRLCGESSRRLAQQACVDGRSAADAGPAGCRMIATAVHKRRRLLGAMVACYPARETPATEAFARACDRAHLDRQAMADRCRREALHAASESDLLASVMEWLVADEQSKEAARTELAALSTQLGNTYEELSLLYRISGSMRVNQSNPEFFAGLTAELLEAIRVPAAAVVLYPGEHSRQPARVVSAGPAPLTDEQIIQVVNRYLMPRLRDSMRATIDNHFAQHAGHLGTRIELVRSLIVAPLCAGESCRGVLLGFNRIDGEFDTTDLKLISSIAGQAAVFLENHHLYEDLQDLLMGMLHALTASIDAKDAYTCGHSRRVALISRKLAELSGFDSRRVGRLYLAGLLHDIGKIGIPESVLCKPGRLTDEEYVIVQRHPVVSAKILSGIGQMEDLRPAILHHHERIDGRGYPSRLAGKEIPIEALIVGLADGFDAMTTSRTYRSAMPLEAVIAEVRRCSGTQFDPHLVQRLLSLDLPASLRQWREMSLEEPVVTSRCGP